MKKSVLFFLVCLLFININLSGYCNTAVEENNYFKIERTPVELKSRLSYLYTGYEYCVKNIYNEPVKIASVSLWNDVNGRAAYLAVQKSNKQARTEVWEKGKSMALPTLSFSMLGSAVAMPFATMKNSGLNNSAKTEAEKYGKKNIQNVVIKPADKYVFRTLTLKRYTPSMRLIYVNPLTDENMSVLMK